MVPFSFGKKKGSKGAVGMVVRSESRAAAPAPAHGCAALRSQGSPVAHSGEGGGGRASAAAADMMYGCHGGP